MHWCSDGIAREIARPIWVDASVCASRSRPNMIEKRFPPMRGANDVHPEFSDMWADVSCVSRRGARRGVHVYSPRPNHSIMMAGMVPNRLPYANPSNIVADHNALTVEMLRTSIWEIMKSDDTMHRQYACGMWRRVRMKSEIRPVKCWYGEKRRAKSVTYDDSTGTVAYAQY